MNEAPDSTADELSFDLGPRRAWLWLSFGVTMLSVAESVGVVAITDALLPGLAAAVVVLLLVLPMVVIVISIASALTGRVTVDAEQLRLRFGLLGGVRVPRADIVLAERFVPTLIQPIGLGIVVPPGSTQATAWRGGPVPYVRVKLGRPILVRTTLWRRSPAVELVVGTKSPDQLVAALR
jgi:hypothetical protein